MKKNPIRFLIGSLELTVIGFALVICNLVQLSSFFLILVSEFPGLSLPRRRNFKRQANFVACIAPDYWWKLIFFFLISFEKMKIEIHGDQISSSGNTVVISNHQGFADTIVLFYLANTVNRARDYKWFSKDSLKYVPGVGWGMVMMGYPFLKRNWLKDRRNFHRIFERFREGWMPYILGIYPEGTRITPRKLELSREFAKRKGVVPYKNVLFPKTKAFVSAVQDLSGHLDSVYDVTVIYDGNVPTVWDFFSGNSPVIRIFLKRFPIQDLPQDEAGLSNWLFDRFREKDQVLERSF